MDTWELNKIAGAALAALLLMFGTATLIEIRMSGTLDKPGFTLPVDTPQATGADTKTAAAAGLNFEEMKGLLQKASVDNGKAAFKRCTTCHTPDKGGRHVTGPNLWGVVGRPKAAAEGFNYSEALKSKGGEWTFEDLAHYIHDPKAFAPGNKMAFAGIRNDAELADLLAYLRTLNDTPPPLPN